MPHNTATYKLTSNHGYHKAIIFASKTDGNNFGCIVHRSTSIIYIFLSLVLTSICLKAQTYTASPDLGNIKGALQSKFQKPFGLNGGVSLNSVLTENWGYGASNPNPFSWIATGNVNIFLLGTSMPFSFCYSNRKVQYTNPSFKFNRFALHPKYKEWTLHIGDLSSTFSPYTLNGFQYTGAGVEYNKGKWQAQALYGRFLKAVKEDSLIIPSFKRIGWGVKTLYNDGGRKIGLSVFHAKDNPASIPSPVLDKNAGITPMENTAFAIEASYPLLQNLLVNFEYSTSILTNDLRLSGDTTTNSISLVKRLVGTANSTTSIYHAIKAGFNYTLQASAIGITYERVDPGYKTLGAYFFTNDFENITANFTQNLWKGIVIIGMNAGLQKDDLNNSKQSRMQRMLLSGNLTVKPSQKLNLGLSYSNQQSYTFLRTGFEQINQVTPYQNLDTLNFTQLSQNAGLNCTYALRQDKQQVQMLTFNCNYMESANKKGDIIRLGDVTRFFNGNAGHSITWQQQGFSLASGVNFSYNYAAMMSSFIWGPSLNMTKTLFKKNVRANFGVSYNTSSCQNKTIDIMNVRGGVNAVIAKKHNLNANVVWQQKTGNSVVSSTYMTATAGYTYSF